MLKTKEIDSQNFELKDLLSCIKSDIESYFWTIFEFDGALLSTSKFNVNSISETAFGGGTGYQVDGKILIQLANDVGQIYDLILVANKTPGVVFNGLDSLRKRSELTIEILDCGKWEVRSKDDQLLHKFQKLTLK